MFENELEEYVYATARADAIAANKRKFEQPKMTNDEKCMSDVIDWAVVINQELAECIGVSPLDLLIDGRIEDIKADVVQLLNCLQRWEQAAKRGVNR